MNKNLTTRLYITSVIVAAALIAALAGWIWPAPTYSTMRALWLLPTLVALVAIAGRFPIKLSRQAEATLVVVPLFVAALVLHPTEATLTAITGLLISEALLKAPLRAVLFNVGINGVATGLAGIVFFILTPGDTEFVVSGAHMLAAGAAGLTLYATNLALVVSMLTIRKGLAFWEQWKQAFAFEAVQEGGFLSVGLITAILVAQAWWAPIVVLIPAILAYYAFEHTVGEAAQKTRLAEELQKSFTNLKELQAQLIESAKMASVGSLATGIAHEINNPVFAISGRADLLIKGADKHLKSEKSIEYVKSIQDMATRISNITRHLMEFAQQDEELKDVNLHESIEAAVSLLGKKTSNAKIVREYQDVAVVHAVPAQLQQLFVNLISNSLEAIPDWGSVTLGCSVEDSMAVAYVKDNGVGIPEEMLGRLFEPFVSSKDVDQRVGLGTGLFTCHKIVTAHHGEIRVDSVRGQGTTVWVRIPLAEQTTETDEVAALPIAVGQAD